MRERESESDVLVFYVFNSFGNFTQYDMNKILYSKEF